jgi:hypothetical protein
MIHITILLLFVGEDDEFLFVANELSPRIFSTIGPIASHTLHN